MEKKYEALLTKSFTDGQALADIIKGRKYTADRDGEWFIDEFGDKRYLPQAEFDEHFRAVKLKSYQLKAKNRYKTSGKTVAFYMTLHKTKDQDIIARLEEMKETAESKQATKGGRNGKSDYIRRLIREDIANNGKQENSVEEYIKLLKRNILYGWVTCGSEAETYIEDTYEEFIKQKGEENA